MSNGRRESDKCSTDKALELVCAKAYQQVLESGENTAIIEAAINKCRELKVESTGNFPVLKGVSNADLPMMLRRQAE